MAEMCRCGLTITPPKKYERRWWSTRAHRPPGLQVRALALYGDDPDRLWFERSEDNDHWIMWGRSVDRAGRLGVVLCWSDLAYCRFGVEHVLVALHEPHPPPPTPIGAILGGTAYLDGHPALVFGEPSPKDPDQP